MRRNPKPVGKILTAHRAGNIIRAAVLVRRGRDVEAVRIVEVDRHPPGEARPLTADEMHERIIERACYTTIGRPGTTLVTSVHNGDVFTGL